MRHYANYVLRPDSWDQGRFTIEGSRPFSCLKAWTSLKVFGSNGFKLLFENAFALTAQLKDLVEAHENFEVMNTPELFIFNYRFVPAAVQTFLAAQADPGRIERINEIINMMNIELHRAIRKKDTSFVSRTVLESTRYAPQPLVVLRAVTINPLTTGEILKEIVDEHNRLGLELYEEFYRKRFTTI